MILNYRTLVSQGGTLLYLLANFLGGILQAFSTSFWDPSFIQQIFSETELC